MNHTVPPIIRCTDESCFLRFLQKIDKTLPVALSARVDLLKFARTNLERGYVFAIEDEEGELACAAVFYYHFRSETAAYLDLMATVPAYCGRGYANALMDAMEAAAKRDGMCEFHLHTNDTNVAALSLYGKRGYEIIAYDPKVHMKKDL
ncbi:MAG: GNAT family N-acetyltransferase [Clostridia bacterium]|nr:GNAT family N-acetyltransferase [Clostridia bacterium]